MSEEINDEAISPINMRDTLRSIEDKIDDMKKDKHKQLKDFKMPVAARVTSARAKKNWVTILYLRENNNAIFLKAPISGNVVQIEGMPHIVKNEHIIIHKNKPMVIVPEWSIDAFSPRKESESSVEDGRSPVGLEPILSYLESEKLSLKKKSGAGVIILLIVIAGAAAYYFFGGGAV